MLFSSTCFYAHTYSRCFAKWYKHGNKWLSLNTSSGTWCLCYIHCVSVHDFLHDVCPTCAKPCFYASHYINLHVACKFIVLLGELRQNLTAHFHSRLTNDMFNTLRKCSLFLSFFQKLAFLHKLKLNSPDKLSAVKTQTQQTSYLIKPKFCLHE